MCVNFEQFEDKFRLWHDNTNVVFEQTSSGTRLISISQKNELNFLRSESSIWKIEFIGQDNSVSVCENNIKAKIVKEIAYG